MYIKSEKRRENGSQLGRKVVALFKSAPKDILLSRLNWYDLDDKTTYDLLGSVFNFSR